MFNGGHSIHISGGMPRTLSIRSILIAGRGLIKSLDLDFTPHKVLSAPRLSPVVEMSFGFVESNIN